jgi:hypothetical protein
MAGSKNAGLRAAATQPYFSDLPGALIWKVSESKSFAPFRESVASTGTTGRTTLVHSIETAALRRICSDARRAIASVDILIVTDRS